MPGAQELVVVVLVALFVLGPERLPEVARGAGRLLRRARNYGVTASKELRGVTGIGDLEEEVTELRRELERTRNDLRRAIRETRTAVDAVAPQVTDEVSAPGAAGTADDTAPDASPDAATDASLDEAPEAALDAAPDADRVR